MDYSTHAHEEQLKQLDKNMIERLTRKNTIQKTEPTPELKGLKRDPDANREYRNQVKKLLKDPKYSDEKNLLKRDKNIDKEVSTNMLKKGYTEQQMRIVLEKESPVVPVTKVKDYSKNTVKDVNRNIEKERGR